MLEDWYLNSSPLAKSPAGCFSLSHVSDYPWQSFDVKLAERLLNTFAENNNKNREQFAEIMGSNGLQAREADHIVCGWGQRSVNELIEEVLRENSQRMESCRKESNKKALSYLEEESRYFQRLRSVYSQLSPLEKLAIGRANEVKDLSLSLILAEVQHMRDSPQHNV